MTLHMTGTVAETVRDDEGAVYVYWRAVCRCGWTSAPAGDREQARREGDAHLSGYR